MTKYLILCTNKMLVQCFIKLIINDEQREINVFSVILLIFIKQHKKEFVHRKKFRGQIVDKTNKNTKIPLKSDLHRISVGLVNSRQTPYLSRLKLTS